MMAGEKGKNMNIIFALISLCITLYGQAPVFTTFDQLPEDRQGQIYIVVEYGECLDAEGNGIAFGQPEGFDYVSYSSTDAQPGDIVTTYYILNPDTNFCDDILHRFDVIN